MINEPLEAEAGIDDEQQVRLVSDLVSVLIDPQRLSAIVAFLAEIGQLADELLVLDLDAARPDAVYDPRWSENGG